jgi:tetratricopeptide (TPR) repeat protein
MDDGMDDIRKGRMRLALVALGLLLLAGAGMWWGRPPYRHWKERRFVTEAQAFMAKGDYANGSLCARQALALNPSNLVACQLMAGVAEMVGSPAVLDWRRRLAEVSPTPENRLALAATALRFQQPPYPLAVQILDDLRPGTTNMPIFYVVSADLAIRMKELEKAESHFAAAARLDPTNELYRLNLATLRLGSTNAVLAAEGRAVLESLRRSTDFGAVALRSLASDSLRHQDMAAARTWSDELITNPRCTTEDRLQHLDLLLPGQGLEFMSYLEGLKKGAVTNTNLAEVRGLSTWMIQHDRAGEALQWLTNMPPAVRSQQPVPLAIAETCFALKDWPAVQGFLADKRWADLEFLRFALLSQASVQQKQIAASTLWRSAVRETGDRLGPQVILLTLADAWQRTEDKEELLWHVYERHPGERWTLQELGRLYQAEGNTRGLNKLFGVLAELNPKDIEVNNNFAATSLLLKVNVNKALELAKELYMERPDHAVIASTYAFALHLRGNTREGLAVFQKLKPEALDDPSVAAYYGILLSASGQPALAKKYLDLAQPAKLLPEEKQLLETARKGL